MTPDAVQTADVLARAHMEQGAARPAISPDKQAAQDKADKLAANYKTTKDTDPLAGLRKRTENNSQKPEELRNKAAEKLPKAFGTEKNPPAAGTPAETRLNNTKAAAERATLLSEKGFDALPPADQTALETDVVKNVLDTRPAYASLEDPEKAAIARGMLKDPEAQKVIAAVLAEKMDAEMLTPDIEQKFNNAIDKAKAADAEATNALGEISKARDELKKATDKRDEFMDYSRNTPPGIKGAKHDEYIQNMTEKARLEGLISDRINHYRREKAPGSDPDNPQAGDAYIADLKATVQRKLDVNADRSTFDSHENSILEMMEWEGEVARIGTFATELSDATANIDALNKKLSGGPPPGELQQKHVDALNARTQALVEFAAVDAEKAVQEEKLLKDMDGVVAEAVNNYLDADLEALKNQLDADSQTLEANAKDEMQKTIAARMKDRWDKFNTDRKGNIKKIEIKKTQVDRDYAALLTGGGPEGIMRDMLGIKSQVEIDREADPAVKAAEQAKLDSFKGKLTDPEMISLKNDIAGRVITRKAQSGKIFEADMRLLIEDETCKAGMEKMIKNNKDLKDYIDKTYAQIDSPSYVDRLKRSGTKNVFALLIMALAAGKGLMPSVDNMLKSEGVNSHP